MPIEFANCWTSGNVVKLDQIPSFFVPFTGFVGLTGFLESLGLIFLLISFFSGEDGTTVLTVTISTEVLAASS